MKKEIINEATKLYKEILNKYFPDNIQNIVIPNDSCLFSWIKSDIEDIILENGKAAREDIISMIKENPYNRQIFRNIEIDKIDKSVTVRSDFDTAFENVEKGYELSDIIGYGLSKRDLSNLACLHKEGKHCEKIEDLLEDCNFHTELSDFIEHKYENYIEDSKTAKYYEISCSGTGTIETCAEALYAPIYIGDAENVTFGEYDLGSGGYNCKVDIKIGVFADNEQEALELSQEIIEEADYGDIEDVTVEDIKVIGEPKEVKCSDIDVSKYSCKALITLVNHCKGDNDLLKKIAEYNSENYDYNNPSDYDLAETVINNCDQSSEILNKYINNDNYFVRAEVAYNSGGNADILNKLVDDEEPEVRVNVACACAGNMDILKKLSKDEDADVRRAATDSIKYFKDKVANEKGKTSKYKQEINR